MRELTRIPVDGPVEILVRHVFFDDEEAVRGADGRHLRHEVRMVDITARHGVKQKKMKIISRRSKTAEEYEEAPRAGGQNRRKLRIPHRAAATHESSWVSCMSD